MSISETSECERAGDEDWRRGTSSRPRVSLTSSYLTLYSYRSSRDPAISRDMKHCIRYSVQPSFKVVTVRPRHEPRQEVRCLPIHALSQTQSSSSTSLLPSLEILLSFLMKLPSFPPPLLMTVAPSLCLPFRLRDRLRSEDVARSSSSDESSGIDSGCGLKTLALTSGFGGSGWRMACREEEEDGSRGEERAGRDGPGAGRE